MRQPVKPKRRYDSSRRSTQAAATRDVVTAAARSCFLQAGWQGTTIAAVARAASVSSETIYATFGSKQALLQAVVQRAIRRTQPDTPLLAQAGPQSVAKEPDQRAQLALFARDITEVLGSVAEVLAVVRTAAENDAALRDLYRSLHEGRRNNLGFAAKALLQRGHLRGNMDADAATTVLWRLASPELYLLMTRVEGLDAEAYAQWLEDMLVLTLLPPTGEL